MKIRLLAAAAVILPGAVFATAQAASISGSLAKPGANAKPGPSSTCTSVLANSDASSATGGKWHPVIAYVRQSQDPTAKVVGQSAPVAGAPVGGVYVYTKDQKDTLTYWYENRGLADAYFGTVQASSTGVNQPPAASCVDHTYRITWYSDAAGTKLLATSDVKGDGSSSTLSATNLITFPNVAALSAPDALPGTIYGVMEELDSTGTILTRIPASGTATVQYVEGSTPALASFK